MSRILGERGSSTSADLEALVFLVGRWPVGYVVVRTDGQGGNGSGDLENTVTRAIRVAVLQFKRRGYVHTKRQSELYSEVWKLSSQSSTGEPALLPCALLPRQAAPVSTVFVKFLSKP